MRPSKTVESTESAQNFLLNSSVTIWNRPKIWTWKLNRSSIISPTNSVPVFLANFYGYVELKDIRAIDISASETQKYID